MALLMQRMEQLERRSERAEHASTLLTAENASVKVSLHH